MITPRKTPHLIRIVGELVLIVVAVLIALWVDNVNAGRRDRLQEADYLSGIMADLHSDSVDLEDRRATAVRGLEVADQLLALRGEFSIAVSSDSLAEWLSRAAFVDNFQVLDHTYREILGAGGLTLISDEDLRREISSYYRSIESAEFFTDWYKDEESDYWNLLAERLHPADFEAATRSKRGGGALDADRVLAQLRSDNEIVNAILMNRHWTELRLGITERRLAANHALAESLRLHLSQRGAP